MKKNSPGNVKRAGLPVRILQVAGLAFLFAPAFGDSTANLLTNGGFKLGRTAVAHPIPNGVRLDDGTCVTVVNASQMPDSTAAELVVAADRSTQSGSPSAGAAKGFISGGTATNGGGDRVCVTDYYIAWFDYTPTDGIPAPSGWPATWARSGTLAGLWSLRPYTHNFRYPYSSTSMTGGASDPSNNVESNWARNELIPGSNSPKGQTYWWDRYSPPLEHSIVVPSSKNGSQYDFFSTVYAQKNTHSGFTNVADGVVNRLNNDVTYKTSALMTDGILNTAVTNIITQAVGTINSNVEFICHEQSIEVTWNFEPSVTVPTENLFVYLWASYSGTGSTTCYPSPPGRNYLMPGYVYGYPAIGKNKYGYDPYPYVQTCQNGTTNASQMFPFASDIPGSRTNPFAGTPNPADPPVALPVNTSLTVGYSSDMNFNTPRWQMINLGDTTQSGSGTTNSPLIFPFHQMYLAYENSDQVFGLGLAHGPYANSSQWFSLQGGMWYQVHYSLSTSF